MMDKSIKFDFDAGEVCTYDRNIMTVTGREALRQWIDKLLRTAADRYPVYDGTKYGTGIEGLCVGKMYEYDFAKAEIIREIRTALLANDEINAVHSFDVNVRDNVLSVSFTVDTIYGSEVIEYDG